MPQHQNIKEDDNKNTIDKNEEIAKAVNN